MKAYVESENGKVREEVGLCCSKVTTKEAYDAMLRENGKRIERACCAETAKRAEPLKFSVFQSLTHEGDLRLLDSDGGLSQEVLGIGDVVFLLDGRRGVAYVRAFVLIED